MTPARDPLIIALTGRKYSGKDSAARYLCRRYGFAQVAFADPIKELGEVLCEHACVDHDVLYNPLFKERPVVGLCGVTPRRLMQTLGESLRTLHPDFFVELLERRVGIPQAAPVHDRIVVSDVRYDNEATWARRQGGIVVQLVREQALVHDAHSSEAGVALQHVSHVIDNGGTLGQLHTALDGLCRTLGIDSRDPLGV